MYGAWRRELGIGGGDGEWQRHRGQFHVRLFRSVDGSGHDFPSCHFVPEGGINMISPLPSYIDIAAGPTRRSRRKLTTYEEAARRPTCS